jgi:hypothetical protein
MITVCCSSDGAGADDFPKNERRGSGSPGSKSGAGMVGARNWAGAVVAHSRSGLGGGGGGIRVGVADSVTPQLLQKFAPSRFSVLQTGQIKAMAYLLTTLGNRNEMGCTRAGSSARSALLEGLTAAAGLR